MWSYINISIKIFELSYSFILIHISCQLIFSCIWQIYQDWLNSELAYVTNIFHGRNNQAIAKLQRFPSIFYANATFFTFSCIYLNFSSLCKTTHYPRLNKTCYISLKNEIRQFFYISSMCTGFPYQNLLLFLNATKRLNSLQKPLQ